MYYALFDSYLRYDCQKWGQIQNKTIESIKITQNKATIIQNFKSAREEADNLY